MICIHRKKCIIRRRSEIFTAARDHIVVFWFLTMCNLVDGYQCLGVIYCLHVQARN
jgi:hypothetical protein